jgi:hypothetical protein
LVFGLAGFMSGCGSPPPDYAYHGVLLHADGSPAANVQLVVAPASSIFRGIPKDSQQVTTDSAGHFSGGFGNDMDGHDWARLPLPAMPPLAGVYVWVQEDAGWQPIPVSLDTFTEQKQQGLGAQQILLPPVRLPARSMPATQPGQR